MKPNILLLGYQSAWRASNNKEIEEYFVAIKSVDEFSPLFQLTITQMCPSFFFW